MKIVTTNVEAMGFAIPSNVAQRILGDLVIYGRVIRPYLGVKIVSAAEAKQYYGLSIDKGIYVAKIVAGSPADRTGIRVGDVIIKIDGEDVSTLGDLRRVLDKHKPGDEVTVELVRSGQTLILTAKLVEAPEE